MNNPDPDKNGREKITFEVYVNGEPQGDYPPDDGAPADFTVNIGGPPKQPEDMDEALDIIAELRTRIDGLEWAITDQSHDVAEARMTANQLNGAFHALRTKTTDWALWASDVMGRAIRPKRLGGQKRGQTITEEAEDYWRGVANEYGHLFVGIAPGSHEWGRVAGDVETAMFEKLEPDDHKTKVPTKRRIRERMRALHEQAPDLFS